ncbi:MAG: S-layer y domain protein [Firmicutes bacterium]|nr:S-layer y domain protein [Bacillota bacterium]
MKKKLVAILMIVFVFSFAGTAFAAVTGNPFVDVPANHWSYGAVKKLAAAGIIEGADGRFNGDKTFTRYEIAVMVAKALAKEEKADAEQQALIEKLSAEYRVELQNMGLRLNKVEEKANKVNFYGFLGLRYDYGTGNYFGSAAGIQTEAAHVDTYTTFKIDDNSTVGIENMFQNNLRSTGKIAGSLYDAVNPATSSEYTGGYNQLAYSLFVNTALDKVKFTVGQFAMIPAYGLVESSEDLQGSRVKGVKASYVTGHVTTTLFSGKTLGLYNLSPGKYNMAEIDYALSKVTNVKAAYHNADAANYSELGFDTKLTGDLAFEAAAAKSDLDVAANEGYYAQLKYKQAMFWAVPHSYDLFAGYRKIGTNATLNGGSNSDFNGNYTYDVKGVIVGAHYVPSKMTMLTTWYAVGKTISDNKDKNVFRTQLDFFF